MPPLLRPRLVCHYCGKRSNSKQLIVTRFKCEHCLAVNHLDENGEIADVPPEHSASPRQYAKAINGPVPTNLPSLESSIFCSTCTKNQQLLTESIANYLPPSNDPSYTQYEASFPEYKKGLEERYPQVCAQCEPKVRERLQHVGYQAKADHLRRMMDRSRARRIANRWGWRSLVVTTGATGYFASVMGQLLWHAMGALSTNDSLTSDDPVYCLHCLLREQRVAAECVRAFAHTTGLALAVGLLCMWWNPKWQHKLQGKEGRLTGLRQYYKVQSAILLIRFGVWIWLQDPETSGVSLLAQNALHSAALVLSTILTLASLFIVKVDTAPLVNWHEPIAPLLSQDQYRPAQNQFLSPPNSEFEVPKSQGFSIKSLAPNPEKQYQPWQAPTPPEEEADAMEWEPSRHFQPVPRALKIKPAPQPSPFHGTIPAMPTNRLLHPKPESQPRPREPIGIPPGFFDKTRSANGVRSTSTLVPMAQPKFFPQKDREADTGLENIFGKVFSLVDEPPELRQQKAQKSSSPGRGMFNVPARSLTDTRAMSIFEGVAGVLLGVSLVVWVSMSCFSWHSVQAKLGILGFVASIPLIHLVTELRPSHSQQRIFEISLFSFETVVAAALALHRWREGYEDGGKYDLCVAGLLSTLLWQEVLNMSGVHATPPPPKSERLYIPQSDGASVIASPGDPISNWNGNSPSDLPGLRSRPRSDSLDSVTSSLSAATTATTSGWKTPKLQDRGVSQSPGFSLGSLALEDSGPSVSRPSFPQTRSGRRRNGF